MTPAHLQAAGFIEDAAEGRFFCRDAAGQVGRFGVRQCDGDVFLKETLITIDWAAGTARREDRTGHGFPHPDSDPMITLEQHLAGWLDELIAADSFKQVCSFCGKQHTEVAKLIAGPTAMICNECVALCQEILAE
jgi:hypothetical protein